MAGVIDKFVQKRSLEVIPNDSFVHFYSNQKDSWRLLQVVWQFDYSFQIENDQFYFTEVKAKLLSSKCNSDDDSKFWRSENLIGTGRGVVP